MFDESAFTERATADADGRIIHASPGWRALAPESLPHPEAGQHPWITSGPPGWVAGASLRVDHRVEHRAWPFSPAATSHRWRRFAHDPRGPARAVRNFVPLLIRGDTKQPQQFLEAATAKLVDLSQRLALFAEPPPNALERCTVNGAHVWARTHLPALMEPLGPGSVDLDGPWVRLRYPDVGPLSADIEAAVVWSLGAVVRSGASVFIALRSADASA